MTRLRRTVRIEHSAENLFELVSDIKRYPEFIRWIQSMTVQPITETDGIVRSVGKARVGFKGFNELFATKVSANPREKTVQVSLVEGPLKHLENEWRFRDVGSATDVDFFIDFEFRNFILRALASANFEIAFQKIMDAFISEADRRYGKPQPARLS